MTGYQVAENGAWLATTSATTLDVSGLTCDSSYAFSVAAVDASGASSGAVSLTVRTAACPASTPPAPSSAPPSVQTAAPQPIPRGGTRPPTVTGPVHGQP